MRRKRAKRGPLVDGQDETTSTKAPPWKRGRLPRFLEDRIESENVMEIALFLRNCMLIGAVVAAPYVLMQTYLWFHLRSGILRPVVRLNDPRQVLVFGIQGSGTTQMAKELNSLGLEISHESSDAMDDFARDGTISWAHSLYMVGKDKGGIEGLCSSPRLRILHSTQFEQTKECSYRVLWDDCWERECKRVMEKNFGCMRHGNSCETRFNRHLLQVRHPTRNIASLVVKYCKSAEDNVLPHQDVMAILAAFYPHVDWYEMNSCIEVFTKYYIEFNTNMLDSGFIDDFYRVEESDPCDVATLAGFIRDHPLSDSRAYQPSSRRATETCKSRADKPLRTENSPTEHGNINRVNQGKFALRFSDIKKANPGLYKELKKLSARLGYGKT